MLEKKPKVWLPKIEGFGHRNRGWEVGHANQNLTSLTALDTSMIIALDLYSRFSGGKKALGLAKRMVIRAIGQWKICVLKDLP